MSARISSLLAAGVLAAGCDPTSEAAFLHGRGFNPCIEVLPACVGLYAACVLDTQNYAQVQFPGEFRFVVNAQPEVEIEIAMYLSDQRDSGTSTYMYWNEPACADVYTFDSGGRNLFDDEIDHVLRVSHVVHVGGEHLIEINSDMQARVSLKVNLIEPGD